MTGEALARDWTNNIVAAHGGSKTSRKIWFDYLRAQPNDQTIQARGKQLLGHREVAWNVLLGIYPKKPLP